MRIPALIGVIAIVYLLPKIGEHLGADVRQITWFACLNPLIVIDFVGGAHNDAWMMGLVVVGLWVATKPHWWVLSAVIIGVATSIKQPGIVAAIFLPLLAHPFTTARYRLAVIGRSVASLGIAIAVFMSVSVWCGLGFGWLDAIGVPGSVPSISPSHMIGTALQALIDPGGSAWLTGATRLGMGIGAVFMVYVTLRYGLRQPMKALSWAWIAAALSASALHSWYLLWGGLLLPMAGSKRRVPWPAVLVVILMLCYAAINMGERNGIFAIVAAGVCMLAWLAHIIIYHRFWTMVTSRHSQLSDAR
jgi:hypothetical protein